MPCSGEEEAQENLVTVLSAHREATERPRVSLRKTSQAEDREQWVPVAPAEVSC